VRTNIVLNDQLVKEAFAYAQVSTKKALIELALTEFVENHRRRDVRELRGHVKLDAAYDYKALRSEGDEKGK
jgi:Arc/MetJ family transcription regulator